ncbi:MCE family protein [Sulfitobacter albidus]|uniref:MCE family protein n=1 Tax=Sulfitobacter albidus TaxID=2829501 RepID=A0A975JCX4_9RHOB|nr:MlaD family protein [Sulfitobacter albidus]QUJ75940.1 MCE family protein [Sulfitobacter albidus]
MSDTPPKVAITPAKKAGGRAVSLIWIIPVLALVVAFYIAWQSYASRGPVIVVAFDSGAGISEGETELRYREITVGKVEKISFSEGLGQVEAHIRISKDVAPYIDASSVFWIVEPEVSAQGVSGLSTVLSGVYIEGSWDTEIGAPESRFSGADESPLIRPGEQGLQIAFRTTSQGNLTDNAPIMFRGIEVGQLGRAQIAQSGAFAIVEGLIFEEHRSLVNSSTRFWDTSGFSVSIGPSGAEIDFSSLATLVGGGITFDTFVSGGDPVQDGDVFEVYVDRETARNSLFSASEVDPLQVSVLFEENVSGLTVGAPVELSGLKIGVVDSLSGVVNRDQFGDNRVRLNVILSLQPARLGLPGDVTADAALSFLQERVRNGLRARLASASLLTGGLKVELVNVPDAGSGEMIADGLDLPIMPTTQSNTSETAATVEGVFNRINGLPIEELLNSAINVMNSADALISNRDLQETPGDIRDLLTSVTGLVQSDDVRNIPVSLNATLTRIEALVGELEEQQIATTLRDTLQSASDAADAVITSVDGVPELVSDLQSVAAKADALDLEGLLAEVTRLTQSAEALVASDAVAALPADISQLFTDLSDLITSPDVQAVPATLNATLSQAGNALTQLEEQRVFESLSNALNGAAEAAQSVTSSVEGVPELVAQIEAVAAKAEQLELNTLFDELTALTRSADALVSSPDTAQLPAALAGALDELNATLAELRAGGAVANVNQTLASARSAADSIATSAQDVPRLITRLNALLVRAGTTIEGYNRGDQVTREVEATLRDIQQAASALEKLARTIERNPNSLLLGR